MGYISPAQMLTFDEKNNTRTNKRTNKRTSTRVMQKELKTKSMASKQQGFTLIEIVVAVLILAIGILGVAGMQSVGVRESQNTYFRSQANLLVIDMANKMIANREQARLGNDSAYLLEPPENATCDFDGASCDAGAIAGLDLKGWEDAVQAAGLPNAGQAIEFVGGVELDGQTVTAIYDIQVFWDEAKTGALASGCDNASGCVSWRVQI